MRQQDTKPTQQNLSWQLTGAGQGRKKNTESHSVRQCLSYSTAPATSRQHHSHINQGFATYSSMYAWAAATSVAATGFTDESLT